MTPEPTNLLDAKRLYLSV